MYGYGYGVQPPSWGVGQAPPAQPLAWLATDASVAQHARYMLQEAMAWLMGAGVDPHTFRQEVERLLMQMQAPDPPFRSHTGQWVFGTHWMLRRPPSASTGWRWDDV